MRGPAALPQKAQNPPAADALAIRPSRKKRARKSGNVPPRAGNEGAPAKGASRRNYCAIANQPLLISTPLSFVVEQPPSNSATAAIVTITVNFFICAKYWRIAPKKATQ